MPTLKNRIKELRSEKGWSQTDLAIKTGLSRNSISSLERGEFGATAYNAGIICKALNKTFEEVFYFEER